MAPPAELTSLYYVEQTLIVISFLLKMPLPGSSLTYE
jgi:hypothetical protein